MAGPDCIGWRRLLPLIGVVFVWLTPVAADACGACVEDKIAATYDHALAMRAVARGEVMVYCEVTGSYDRHRLSQVARRVRGIDVDSVRTSVQPATVSFAVDPSKLSPEAAVEATQRGLSKNARLTIVRSGKAKG